MVHYACVDMASLKQHTKLSSESRFRALVLYDGYCVLCNWFVRFILRIDRSGVVGFAALDSKIAKQSHAKIPANVDSVVLVEGPDVRVRSAAVFRVFDILGGGWHLLRIFRVLPLSLTDGIYDWVARRRTKIFGRYDACPLPDERFRERFIADE